MNKEFVIEAKEEPATLHFGEKPLGDPGHFIFNVDDNTWIIDISKEGIKFNRELFPDRSVDDFANAFIGILEKEFPERMRELFMRKENDLD